MRSTVTSRGSSPMIARISCRSPSGTPAAGSSRSSTAWPRRDGDGDFEEALAAIGERRRGRGGHVGEAETIEKRGGFIDQCGIGAGRPPPAGCAAPALGHGDIDRLDGREPREELIDLEGPGEAAAHAAVARRGGDVLAVEDDAAAARLEQAGEQIDERRLAGAVRADQRVTGSALETQRDAARRDDAAETLVEIDGFEGDRHDAPRFANARAACRRKPAKRSRPTSTMATRRRPIQNSQYCGVRFDNASCMTLKTIAPISPP